MLHPGKTSQSILFLTDDKERSRPFIDEMRREKIEVHLSAKNWKRCEYSFFQGVDLVILESERLSLEELSMYTRIRSVHKGLLTVFTEKLDEMFQVMLYEQGVDALLIKPIKPLLFLAQIRALFRRNNRWKPSDNVVFNGLEINGGSRSATFEGEEIPLSSREFDLLWYLAQNSCITIDRDKLYQNVFGVEYNGYDRAVDMYISRIRQKLSENTTLPSPIKTVRGRGYLFTAE